VRSANVNASGDPMSLHHPAVRGLIRGGILVALLTIILVGCAGSGAVSPSTPPASDPAVDLPTAVPAALSLDDLAGDLGGLADQSVTIAAYLFIDGDQAQLCSALLESYPPQCGGASVRLLGEVPSAVIDGLEETSDPGQAITSWGPVLVSGTVGTDDSGAPAITISSIELADSL
jgi:hypothetical protein